MSSRPQRPRRSCHCVPATSPRMVAKAASLAADLVFFDLEDSVAAGAKGHAARQAVVDALLAGRSRARGVGVRVNAVDTPQWHEDVAHVVGRAGAALDVVILPKVDDPTHITLIDDLLATIERRDGLPVGTIGLEAQIESARGLLEVERIAAASPRLESLVFGPGDYAASMGMPVTTIGGTIDGYPGDPYHYPLSRIVVTARAFGLQAIDGPHADVRDAAGLRASAARSRALGFDGKWSIHPDQIVVLNEVYGVSQDDLAHAVRVLDAYRQSLQAGHGAALLDGEMLDEATRRMAEGVVARARLTAAP